VRVDVVDEEADLLGVRSAEILRALLTGLPRLLPVTAPHHDEPFAVRELRVDDLARVALDLQAHLEPERVAEPVDRRGRILVVDRLRHARPTGGCGLHGGSSSPEMVNPS